MKLTTKQIVSISVLSIIFLSGLICLPQIFDTVKKGTYQIKQAAVSGKMSAKMKPGVWLQMFGDIETWPKAETYTFTHDRDNAKDTKADTSMEVRFVDGSTCKISGTSRIILPSTETEAISIVVDSGYTTYNDLEEKLIKPTIRKILRHTANLMTATESFKEKRGQFITMCADQFDNGMYKTTTEKREIIDLVSGEKLLKEVNVVATNKDGSPIYEPNSLIGTGIKIKNFEVKSFRYDPKVKAQIEKQQDALMAVQTAKANAQKAEQDKLTIEAQGKARVAEAEYQELEKKVVSIVQAQRDKEMALIAAEKKKEQASIERDEAIIIANKKTEVAKLDAVAAEQEKKANILRGEGEATRKKMVMQADGALELKAETWLRGVTIMSENFGKQKWVSEISMGSSDKAGSSVMGFMEVLAAKAAKDLNFDLNMENKN